MGWKYWSVLSLLSRDFIVIVFKIAMINLIFVKSIFFYKTMTQFQFQTNLDQVNVFKYMQAFSKFRVSSHRLAIESGSWARPTSYGRAKMCMLQCFRRLISFPDRMQDINKVYSKVSMEETIYV